MKKVIIFLSSIFIVTNGHAQGVSIQVNPDGTHSVIHNTDGNVAIKVNPDGSHSVIHNNENIAIQVNPNGSHTVVHRISIGNDRSAGLLWVNPDGSHSVIHSTFVKVDSSPVQSAKLRKTKRHRKKE
jgi:hypothetical protein